MNEKCLTPGCEGRYTHGKKDGSARGLCGPCYQAAKRMVKLNKTTWRELEDLKLAISPLREVPDKKTLFEKAFEELKNKG